MRSYSYPYYYLVPLGCCQAENCRHFLNSWGGPALCSATQIQTIASSSLGAAKRRLVVTFQAPGGSGGVGSYADPNYHLIGHPPNLRGCEEASTEVGHAIPGIRMHARWPLECVTGEGGARFVGFGSPCARTRVRTTGVASRPVRVFLPSPHPPALLHAASQWAEKHVKSMTPRHPRNIPGTSPENPRNIPGTSPEAVAPGGARNQT